MKHTLIFVLIVAVIGAIILFFFLPNTTEAPVVSDAGAPVTEPDAGDVADGYVGLSEAEAEALATENGVMFRVVERDGQMLPAIRDYRPGRINATVEAGVVTSYIVEGELEPVAEGNKQGDPNANKYDFGDPIAPDEDEDEDTTGGQHDAIIGLTQADAEAYAEQNEVPFRIGSVDGEARPVTMDYRPGRITASIEDGVVTDYSVEGELLSTPAGEHDAIIGMTEAEATAYAATNEVPFRIGSIDGEALALTEDYRPGRITASIEKGIVVDYSVE